MTAQLAVTALRAAVARQRRNPLDTAAEERSREFDRRIKRLGLPSAPWTALTEA
ncbi:MAG TPA: hypothetical protein VNA20_17455 [Frankiaceae bacterium]|nr:hypothetical protein [Frankiaceae bacterium]